MLQMAMLLCMGMLTVGHRKGKPAGGGQDFFPLGLCSLTGSQEDAGRPANRQTDRALMHNSLKGQGQGYSCYTSLQCCFNFPLVYNESPSLQLSHYFYTPPLEHFLHWYPVKLSHMLDFPVFFSFLKYKICFPVLSCFISSINFKNSFYCCPSYVASVPHGGMRG